MRTEYTDDDTARAREFERSSAGYQTQPLSMPQHTALAPANSKQNLLGMLLIAVGVILLVFYLLGRVVGLPFLPDIDLPGRGELTAGMIQLTISSCFLFFALWRRVYGLLIPGCILAGLGVGIPFAGMSSGVSILWGLAVGFCGIYFISRLLPGWFKDAPFWPLIPAVIMFAVGTIILIATLPSFLLGLALVLPVGLICAGLVLGAARR